MNKIIDSPVSYWGSKRRLLKQLLPLFPKDIETFYDLFCGSLSVSLNVNAKKIIANDLDKNIYNILRLIQDDKNLYEKIIAFLYYFPINNSEEYIKLRNLYNKSLYKSPFILYLLQIHSFNNLIRFNSKNELNMPYGNRGFTLHKKNIFHEIKDRINNINLYNKSYLEFNNFKKNDFVYIDPPYLITSAEYNKYWTEKEEIQLLKYLDNLNSNRIKFGLSNVIEQDGKQNNILLEWAKKYNIINIKIDYNYSAYNKNRSHKNTTREVYICNYDIKKKNSLF